MKTTTIIGVLLIVLGIIFLGPVLGLFTLKLIWPAVLLLIGIGFILAYITAPKITGFLLPGSILVISSIPFFVCTFSNDWTQMTTLWPIFIFSVSIGLFLMYFLGSKNTGVRSAALILLALGVITYLISNYIKFVFPIIFIVAGLVLIFTSITRKKKEKTPNPFTSEQDDSTKQEETLV